MVQPQWALGRFFGFWIKFGSKLAIVVATCVLIIALAFPMAHTLRAYAMVAVARAWITTLQIQRVFTTFSTFRCFRISASPYFVNRARPILLRSKKIPTVDIAAPNCKARKKVQLLASENGTKKHSLTPINIQYLSFKWNKSKMAMGVIKTNVSGCCLCDSTRHFTCKGDWKAGSNLFFDLHTLWLVLNNNLIHNPTFCGHLMCNYSQHLI